jgi:glycosyltransferase involved in cell wall biosynthesis
MRLLILDEAWQAIGGVDTFRRFLLPALAQKVEKLWWANPALSQPRRFPDVDFQSVGLLDSLPPSRSSLGLVAAVLRRTPSSLLPGFRDRLQGALSHRHLRRLVGRLGVTHVLEICVFRRPFPRLGVPTLGLVHDLDYPDRGHSPHDRFFLDWLRHAEGIIAASGQTRGELLELLSSAAPRISVLEQPATPPPVPPPSRQNNPWSRSEPVFYYPAAAIPRKGHAVLLAALAQLAKEGFPFHCYLSGGGTDLLFSDQPLPNATSEAVRQTCLPFREALRNRVTGLGMQPWSAVEELYAAADLIVFPSRNEGYGLPPGEALRRGRPVLASRISSFVNQVSFYQAADQYRLFPAGDIPALTTALRHILDKTSPFPPFSPELQARLAAWSWDAYADRVLATFPTSLVQP